MMAGGSPHRRNKSSGTVSSATATWSRVLDRAELVVGVGGGQGEGRDPEEGTLKYLSLGFVLGLAACGSSWPPGSSVSISTSADASVVAKAMAGISCGGLREGRRSPLCMMGRPTYRRRSMILSRAGVVVQDRGGEGVRYVVGPIDGGELLRVSINDSEGMTRTFSRSADGNSVPAGTGDGGVAVSGQASPRRGRVRRLNRVPVYVGGAMLIIVILVVAYTYQSRIHGSQGDAFDSDGRAPMSAASSVRDLFSIPTIPPPKTGPTSTPNVAAVASAAAQPEDPTLEARRKAWARYYDEKAKMDQAKDEAFGKALRADTDPSSGVGASSAGSSFSPDYPGAGDPCRSLCGRRGRHRRHGCRGPS